MSMIELQGISLAFPHKTCFSNFHAAMDWGQRIAIVGDNGSGKSSLLRILQGEYAPSEGKVVAQPGLVIAHVAQVLDRADGLSGGQRVNQAMTQALASTPDLLLLDEPTNHLDERNRLSLARMLQGFQGSIVLVTHDVALMDLVCDTLWHIGRDGITVFAGRYTEFEAERALRRQALEKQVQAVKRSRQEAHQALMQEQERASHARQRGIKSIREHKWATIKSRTKLGRGSSTAVDKQAAIRMQQRDLADQLGELSPGATIAPRFHLEAPTRQRQNLLQISDGAAGHVAPAFSRLYLNLASGERLALIGDNGSGKSTLARAILAAPQILRHGDWLTPDARAIGYLDQHYANLDPAHSVLQALKHVAPAWSTAQLRQHLSDFLFRHNSAVEAKVSTLSGGEKARLSLACIAARVPELLILDEVTNNLDLATRRHVIDVLRDFPGAMLLISHDRDFLRALGVSSALRLSPDRPPRLEALNA